MPAEVRQKLEEACPKIIEKVIEAAIEGDMAAARLVLDRIAPVSRSTALPVTIKGLEKAEGLYAKSVAVMAAVARAECPADIGANLIQSLIACARIFEIDDLERRIEALEAEL